MNASAFAWLAALVLAWGELPSPERSLDLRLCSGGTLTIPLDDKGDGPPAKCGPKACHAIECRKQILATKKLRS